MKLELEVIRFENEDVIATSTFYTFDDWSHLRVSSSKLYLVDLGGKPPIDEINNGDTVKAKDGKTYNITDSYAGIVAGKEVWNLRIKCADGVEGDAKDFQGTWRSSDNKNWVVE